MALEADLDVVLETIIAALITLEGFVHESREGFAHGLKVAAGSQERLESSLEGIEPPQPIGMPADDLVTIEFTPDELQALADVMKTARGRIEHEYPSMLLNMSLIYLVALFDAFLGDSYGAVLVSRPEMLRSSRQLTYETALSFADRPEMIQFMARREIGETGYKAWRDQLAYYGSRFGVRLDQADIDPEVLNELIARRNLLVHNNGVTNEIYLALVARPAFKLGERITTDEVYWTAAVQIVRAAAYATHHQLVAKFEPSQHAS